MTTDERTHYDVLGVSRDADGATVKRSWKVLVQVWHPDRFNGDMRDEAERMTARINEAYNALRDDSRRAAYDRALDARIATPPSARTAAFSMRTNSAHATGPAGTTHLHSAPTTHPSSGSLLVDAIDELRAVARRYPRASASLVAAITLLLGFAVLTGLANRPSAPGENLAARSTPLVGVDEGPADIAASGPLAEAARAEARTLLRRQLALAEARAAQQPPTRAPRAPVVEPLPADAEPLTADDVPSVAEDETIAPRGRVIRIVPQADAAAAQ